MEPLRRAVEIDFTKVYETLSRYRAQLLHVSVEQTAKYFIKGMVYYDSGIVVVARVLSAQSYLNFPVPKNTWHIVMIASSRQQAGAATDVMQRLLHQANNNAVLSVVPYNIRGIRFYRKFDFRKIGVYHWPTFDVDVMLHKGE